MRCTVLLDHITQTKKKQTTQPTLFKGSTSHPTVVDLIKHFNKLFLSYKKELLDKLEKLIPSYAKEKVELAKNSDYFLQLQAQVNYDKASELKENIRAASNLYELNHFVVEFDIKDEDEGLEWSVSQDLIETLSKILKGTQFLKCPKETHWLKKYLTEDSSQTECQPMSLSSIP